MRPAERLEICFTSNPPTLVSTIILDDHLVAQRTFRDQSQLDSWIATLENIADVTRNIQRVAVTAERRDPTTTQAHAAAAQDHQTADYGDEVSAITKDTVFQASPLSRRQLLERDRVEAGNLPSVLGSTAKRKEIPLSQMPMHLSQPPQKINYTDGILFETSPQSPSSSLSQSIPEVSDNFYSPMSSVTSVAMEELTPELKRRGKLETLLERIRGQMNPDQAEHNEKVDNLFNSTTLFTSAAPTTATQFGHLLGDLGHVSDVLGFMYGLLSWEVFRREEDRLVREEGQSARWAAKRMNDEMSKQSDRHTTTKDWASDGRRAAGMVFRSIVTLNAASKSLAVFLLADLAILDNLVKIAHFPVLRERFATVFKEIHESRERRHNPADDTSYKVFDFEAFLSIDRQPMTLATVDPMARQSQIGEKEHWAPLIQLKDLLLSSADVDNIHKSPRKRRRLSLVSTAEENNTIWSLSLDTGNTGEHYGKNAVPTNSDPLVIADDENKRGARGVFTGSDEARFGTVPDSPQTQDYNILFGPSPDFDTSFYGQKSS